MAADSEQPFLTRADRDAGPVRPVPDQEADMTIKRVSSGTPSGPAASPPVATARPAADAFSVEAPAGVAASAIPAEPPPNTERVIESTRHLRGLGAADLQMIQESLPTSWNRIRSSWTSPTKRRGRP